MTKAWPMATMDTVALWSNIFLRLSIFKKYSDKRENTMAMAMIAITIPYSLVSLEKAVL
jgi:hypothetical protein